MNAAAGRWDATRDPDEVLVMVSALRTILVDGLLDQVVSVKRRMLFADTAISENPAPEGARRYGSGGLARIVMSKDETAVLPLCHSPDRPIRWVRHRDWWSTGQPVKKDGLSVSREFLIYELANTDGLHLDSHLDAEFVALNQPFSNMTLRHPDGSESTLDGAVAASVRQIAWETDHSITVALATLALSPDPIAESEEK